MKWSAIFIESICLLLILIFAYAAFSKIFDLGTLRTTIQQSPILSPFSAWLPFVVIGTEILIALFLMFGKYRLRAMCVSFVMLFVFTVYILFIKKFAKMLPCACGGIIQKLSWNQHLGFNLILMALVLLAIVVHSRQSELKSLLQQ